MADNSFDIKITTTGQPAGADSVAKSLQGVGKAAAETGKESKSLGADLESLGSRQNATKDVIEGLDQAMKGQTASIFGVAKAAKNLWEVLTVSTPMGRLAQLGIIAAGAFGLIREKLSATAKPAEDTSRALDAIVSSAQKANQVRLEALKDELDAINVRAKVAAESIDAVSTSAEKLDKSRMKVELATVAADGSLSPDERAKKEFEIRERYAKQEAAREDQRTAEKLANAEQQARELRAVADREYFDQKKAAQENYERTVANRSKLNADQEALTSKFLADLGAAGRDELTKRQLAENYYRASGAIALRQDQAFGPEADARLAMLRDRATTAGTGTTAASLAAAKAEEELRVLRERASREGYVNAVVRGNESRAARIAAGLPEPTSDRGSRTTVSEPSRLEINGVDVTEKIARQMDQMRALGESAARLGSAIESSIVINGRVIMQIEKTAETLESQIKASRR